MGERALYEEIQIWLTIWNLPGLNQAAASLWYRENDNLLVSDAHEGNVIRSETGRFCY